MRVLTIINQKGGCGKTTTAINLAGILSNQGWRTLLVDLDPQSHCAAGLGIPESQIEQDIADAMLSPAPESFDTEKLLWQVNAHLDLAPSRMRLAGLEASRGGLAGLNDREFRLSRFLEGMRDQYDICLVDCSPAIGLLAFNALAAATDVLIPVEVGFFSMRGAERQVNTVRSLGRRLGRAGPIWILPTLHDESHELCVEMLSQIKRHFSKRVTPVVIRRDPAAKEAASIGQIVTQHAPRSTSAFDYTRLAQWLVRCWRLDQTQSLKHSALHDESDTRKVTVLARQDATRDLGARLAKQASIPTKASVSASARAREMVERTRAMQIMPKAVQVPKPSTEKPADPAPRPPQNPASPFGINHTVSIAGVYVGDQVSAPIEISTTSSIDTTLGVDLSKASKQSPVEPVPVQKLPFRPLAPLPPDEPDEEPEKHEQSTPLPPPMTPPGELPKQDVKKPDEPGSTEAFVVPLHPAKPLRMAQRQQEN